MYQYLRKFPNYGTNFGYNDWLCYITNYLKQKYCYEHAKMNIFEV